MANVKVTYEQMSSAGTRLTSGQTEIEGELTTLRNEVNNLVNSGYVTDSSSKQFEAAYGEFDTGAKKMLEGLTTMSKVPAHRRRDLPRRRHAAQQRTQVVHYAAARLSKSRLTRART